MCIRDRGREFAVCHDGDGDRVLFVEAQGEVVDGDGLIYVLANDWKKSGRLHGPVVGTLMSNYGLEKAFGEPGIDFRRAKVGDRYVHQMLVEGQGILGGEASGHLLCLDRTRTCLLYTSRCVSEPGINSHAGLWP